MSGRCTGWVLKYGPRDRAMRAVLITIADAANAEGRHAHPGIRNVVEGSLYSRSHVLAIIGRLVSEKWLEVEQEGGGRGMATTYSVLMDRAGTVQPLDRSTEKGSNLSRERVLSGAETVQSPYLETAPNGLYNGKEQPHAREDDPEPEADFQLNLSRLRELRKS